VEVVPTKPFSRIPAVGISINILFSYFADSPAVPWLKLYELNNKQIQNNITFFIFPQFVVENNLINTQKIIIIV
jgi:hypothetical protein